MKNLSKLTMAVTTTLALTLTACAAQPTGGRMGNIDCEALRNTDHPEMDHSAMTAEVHALYQACGIEMDMGDMEEMDGMDMPKMNHSSH